MTARDRRRHLRHERAALDVGLATGQITEGEWVLRSVELFQRTRQVRPVRRRAYATRWP